MRRKTLKEFVQEVRRIHGDKYDYGKVVYEGLKKKVIIICPIHSEFRQTPSNHLLGKGCPKCGKVYRRNTGEFIIDAKVVHGDKYDYSKVKYITNRIPVIIICPIHGEISQRPCNHLRGEACLKCARGAPNNERCIERFRSVHGDKYNYSKVRYSTDRQKVTIICPIHGEFEQAPKHHWSGNGCKTCFRESVTSSTEDFVVKAQTVHGVGRFDYSEVKYKNAHEKVIIICPTHGPFSQPPTDHLAGFGCLGCQQSKGAERVAKFLNKLSAVVYQREKKFDDCRDASHLPFDFCIYIDKLMILVEIDGEQHAKPVNYFGGIEAFIKRQRHDQIKNNYVAAKNIPLIRIPHTVKGIEAYLQYELERHLGYSLNINLDGARRVMEAIEGYG